ncbi:DNA-binding protein [Candidatus Woesearchaeota archaeon]|nr:DNA-binding protein [Candidatus Woesearchaeota archaeon]
MKINELQPKQGKVEIVVEITEKEEPREFTKFGAVGKVCSCKAKDETGEIKLTLWNDQIDQVDVGDKVKISNGYVNEYQGEMQLTTGKFGKLEKVEA